MTQDTINSINKGIRDYGTKVKANTIEDHIAFLKGLGDEFKAIKSSEFEISILTYMEIVLEKIIEDIEDERHKGKIDQTLLDALEQLINLNSAMVRAERKGKDVSEDWIRQLRDYIKILRNLSIVALIITSNEFSEKASQPPNPQMKTIFEWVVKNEAKKTAYSIK